MLSDPEVHGPTSGERCFLKGSNLRCVSDREPDIGQTCFGKLCLEVIKHFVKGRLSAGWTKWRRQNDHGSNSDHPFEAAFEVHTCCKGYPPIFSI